MAESLVCAQCNYSNEPERVYCHGCGAKLDRSLLPKEAQEKDEESPEKARKRIQKMTNPKGLSIMRGVKTFFVVLLWAAAVATLLVCLQPPEDLPPNKTELSERFLPSEMMELTESPTPHTLAVTDQEINQSLKRSLKGKEAAPPLFNFERAFVQFFPGVAHLGVEQSLWGFSLFTGIDYRVEVKAGVVTPGIVGGNLGRMPIHPEIMKYCGFLFDNLLGVLKRERGQLQKMQMITLTKGKVTLVSKGAALR